MERNFIDLQQNTQEWWDNKLKRVTASYASNLFAGKLSDSYKINLVDRVAYEIVHNECIESSFYGNGSTERGHIMEPLAARRYENITMRKCTNGGFHTYGDLIGCSVDRNLEDINGNKISGAVEIKCFEHLHHEKIVLNPEIFVSELYNQVQYQLYATGYEFIDIFAYHPNYKDVKNTILPDDNHFEKLEKELDTLKKAIEIQVMIKQSIKRN